MVYLLGSPGSLSENIVVEALEEEGVLCCLPNYGGIGEYSYFPELETYARVRGVLCTREIKASRITIIM